MTPDIERLYRLAIDGDPSAWPVLKREWARRGELWCEPSERSHLNHWEWVRGHIEAWRVASKIDHLPTHHNPPHRCDFEGRHCVTDPGIGFSQRISIRVTDTRWVNVYAIGLDSGERAIRVPSRGDIDDYPVLASLPTRCAHKDIMRHPHGLVCLCSPDQWPADTFIIPSHDPPSLIVEIR